MLLFYACALLWSGCVIALVCAFCHLIVSSLAFHLDSLPSKEHKNVHARSIGGASSLTFNAFKVLCIKSCHSSKAVLWITWQMHDEQRPMCPPMLGLLFQFSSASWQSKGKRVVSSAAMSGSGLWSCGTLACIQAVAATPAVGRPSLRNVTNLLSILWWHKQRSTHRGLSIGCSSGKMTPNLMGKIVSESSQFVGLSVNGDICVVLIVAISSLHT